MGTDPSTIIVLATVVEDMHKFIPDPHGMTSIKVQHLQALAAALLECEKALEESRTTFSSMKRVVQCLIDNGSVIDGNEIIQDCEYAILKQDKALSRLHNPLP